MLAIERLEKIKFLISQNGKASIIELSNILHVSVVTIRKDFGKLEEEGFITRTHGGAVINTDNQTSSANNFLVSNEKSLIGLIASNLVKDGQVIFIGPGSTCYNIAKFLKNAINITIITNNSHVIHELALNEDIVLISTGGRVECNNSIISYTGDFTLEMLSNLLINTAFITVDGISLRNGYTINSNGQVELYNMIRKISNEIIIVADKSKFDKTAMLHFCGLNDLRCIITEKDIPEEYRDFFQNNNVKLIDSP